MNLTHLALSCIHERRGESNSKAGEGDHETGLGLALNVEIKLARSDGSGVTPKSAMAVLWAGGNKAFRRWWVSHGDPRAFRLDYN